MQKIIEEIQVPTTDLELGMQVVRLDKPWLESQFSMQGFVIQSQDELEALHAESEYVFIAYTAEYAALKQSPHNGASRESQNNKDWKKQVGKAKYSDKVPFEQEFSKAKKSFYDARQLAKNIMADVRIGRTLDINKAKAVVENCVDSLLRNPNAVLWLTQIKHKDEYTAEHSMNVSILSTNFARHLGLTESDIVSVGLCGLLHDVGKIKIPVEILNKPGKLTPEEYEVIKRHTTYGRDILLSKAKADAIVIDVAYSHHEREDGSGYPCGLKSHQIPFFAKLVALADTYDAITSHRVYHAGTPSMKALKIIHDCRGTTFDEELVAEFIQCIGVYPPGCIVEMSNGMVGIVLQSYPENRLRPKILAVTDRDKKKLDVPKLLDLSKGDGKWNGEDFIVYQELLNGTHGIQLRDYTEHISA